ncbi:MAG: glycosyltransferase family 4 protein [bacterium]|nr:glycosyltransferase family 4 protein [bacterium]
MRLLIISPWCDDIDLETCKGTPENAYLFRELLKREHEIIFVCQGKEAEIPENVKGKIRFYPIKPFPYLKPSKVNYLTFPLIHIFYEKYLAKTLKKILQNPKVDLIYNIAGYGHPAILKLCKEYKTPYVVKTMGTIHYEKYVTTILGKFLYFKEHLIFKHSADHYLLVDDGTRSFKVAKFYKIPDEKLTILPNAKPSVVPTKSPSLKNTIGYFSRFDRLKGTDFFIRVAVQLININPNIKFLIAGDGPMKPKILEFSHKFSRNVKYLGFLTHLETQKAFQEIDLLISTNRYSNMTLNVIEALTYGIPVVTFDTQDTSKLIKDGVNGFLVKPFDTNEMVNKVLHIFEKPELFSLLQNGALETAKTIPTWEERSKLEVRKLEELVNEIH